MTEYDPDEIEEEVKQDWEENGTRKKVLDRNKGEERFYFLDGPPYATGSIHMGTGMNKILKDYYLRFHRKLGFDVHSQPGYDVHGLPIENKVEEEEGFEKKQDIEDFGVDNFVAKCKQFVDMHIKEMNQDFNDMGVWMTWENPYITYHDYYIEGAWTTFKRAYEKGYLYKDRYSVHVCSRCETAVAYNEIEYTRLEDPEVYVAFPAKDSDEELLIWTTTPWTLPSNTGIMVNPEYEYSLVEFDDRKVWIASALVNDLMGEFEVEDYEIIETVDGEELEGIKYDNPLEEHVRLQEDVEGRVVLSERYVDLESGTGLVHTAPGHGKEDYEMGQEEGLELLNPVNLKGEYDETAGKYEGMYVKDADEEIKEDLYQAGALLHSGSVHHEYPKCWRCDTPLLQLAVPQWFFGSTQFRDDLLDANDEVNWVPDWAGQKFHEWLEQLGDWPVSRQRYWGIPLPIWECEDCDNTTVVGDRSELPEVPDDLHRPYIDRVKLDCEDCGGTMSRIPDVLDVWFDSGVAPWASLRNPELDFSFEEEGPVDLELEGFDQIRGWWNSQFITSMMTFEQRPFDSVIYHGKVMLEGREMSKSKGIVVSPQEAIEKYGRDILRFYILSKDPSEDWSFRWDEMDENLDFMNILWNTYNYRDTYTSGVEKPGSLELEDRWIISRLNSMVEDVRAASTEPDYSAYRAAEAVEEFTKNDLSRSYIQMIRDRLRPGYDGEDRKAAEWTLRHVTTELLKAISPFTPYLAEYLWEGEESIHLQDYPRVDEAMVDEELEQDMDILQEVEEAVARLRQEEGIKLRHPVKKVTVSGNTDVRQAVEDLEELMEERLNAKEVEFEKVELDYRVKLDYANAGPELGDDVSRVEKALSKADESELAEKVESGETVELEGFHLEPEMFDVRTFVPEGREGEEFSLGAVYIDTERTGELVREALVSEVARAIQQERKEAGLDVGDEVELVLKGDFEDIRKSEDVLRERINLSGIEYGGQHLENRGEVEFEDWKVEFSFSRTSA